VNARRCELVVDVGGVHELGEQEGTLVVEAMEAWAEASSDECVVDGLERAKNVSGMFGGHWYGMNGVAVVVSIALAGCGWKTASLVGISATSGGL
jgi:hypothetical protein